MALSVDSKIKQIMRDPQGKAVMDKWAPELADSPALKMVQMMTLRKLLSFPESAEVAKHIDEIDEELKAI